MLVQYCQLAPANGRIIGGEGRDHLAGRLANRQQFETAGAELRVSTMLGQHCTYTRTGKGATAPHPHTRSGYGRTDHASATAHADERERHEV
jgi:hypothetical protein